MAFEQQLVASQVVRCSWLELKAPAVLEIPLKVGRTRWAFVAAEVDEVESGGVNNKHTQTKSRGDFQVVLNAFPYLLLLILLRMHGWF